MLELLITVLLKVEAKFLTDADLVQIIVKSALLHLDLKCSLFRGIANNIVVNFHSFDEFFPQLHAFYRLVDGWIMEVSKLELFFFGLMLRLPDVLHTFYFQVSASNYWLIVHEALITLLSVGTLVRDELRLNLIGACYLRRR